MRIWGHRGYCGKYPENTILSFQKAADAGADGIELDVHETLDGKLVVIHDESVDRTTGQSGFICDMTWDEIKKLNAGIKYPEYGFQPIPSFEEYCAWAKANDVFTDIEIKTDNVYYPDIEAKVLAMVNRYKLTDKVIYSSFNHVSLITSANLSPEPLLTGALVAALGGVRVYPGTYCKKYGFSAYHPQFRILNENLMKDCFDNGIEVNAWDVNDEASARLALALGCQTIITDYPLEALTWVTAVD